ncbi:MAG: hypothetical protein WCP20_18600 [Desulfuromonadales bacterium]
MQLETCPKCACKLSATSETCPRCGVIFAKLARADARNKIEEHGSKTNAIGQSLFQVKDGEGCFIIAIKAVFLALLSVYGFKLIFTPILAFPDSGWWLHAVNLTFHEAGHVLFMPFGRFLHVLGGSLGQLIIPAIVTGAFLFKRDLFGAVVGTWWLGESFLDISPYINDARAGQLMLLGGVTGSEVEDYHDWEVLLTRMGMMNYDHALARLSFTIGTLLMLTAMLWGGSILWKGYRNRSQN